MSYIFSMDGSNLNKPVDDIDSIKTALNWVQEGRMAALACVTQTWGSAPRPVGSYLAINDQGAFVGSVSGGCIEGEVVTEALGLMRSKSFKNLEFAVSDEQASGAGLACGGKVSVHVFPVLETTRRELERLVDLTEQKSEAALISDLSNGNVTVFTPEDRTVSPHSDEIAGLLHKGQHATLDIEGQTALFVRSFLPPLRLLIVGAVHVAQDLAVISKRLGYDVTLIDPRDTWATDDRFPDLTIDRRMPGDALATLKPDQRTAVVALCHDPKLDDPALVEALKTRAFYIGALGGQKNHGRRLGRLAEYGFNEQTLSRINGPIGLDIGARTPAEIAISILAEMTQKLRRG